MGALDYFLSTSDTNVTRDIQVTTHSSLSVLHFFGHPLPPHFTCTQTGLHCSAGRTLPHTVNQTTKESWYGVASPVQKLQCLSPLFFPDHLFTPFLILSLQFCTQTLLLLCSADVLGSRLEGLFFFGLWCLVASLHLQTHKIFGVHLFSLVL
jgi:hypothetical protein